MRSLWPLGALILCGAIASAAPPKRVPKPDAGRVDVPEPEIAPDLGAVPDLRAPASHPLLPGPGGKEASARCELCHSVQGWTKDPRFDHSRTGFELKGQHAQATCAECHARGYVGTPTLCSACHQDVHEGRLGARCDGCHNELEGWMTRFDADAHRRTNFPLTGRHALIPCQECHLDTRDRTFGRATVDCVGCHAKDLVRTVAVLDHQALGFSSNCRLCHDTAHFQPARFPSHDSCFQLTGGPHNGFRCQDCHTSIPARPQVGTCSTNTASCTSCHTHACERTAGLHSNVPGYQCKDRKCYECHRFTPGG
jgi:hypothetical protein